MGFEDPRRPGSGGGSLRTYEVNRRLAERHDITVITTKYPGWADRVEDGVTYRHAGIDAGYVASVMSYFAALPRIARTHEYDLIVEDFSAPISSILAPLWSKAPSVAMVQWLFARDLARKYHLPVQVFEWLGTRTHRTMITTSADLAARLRSVNPRTGVHIIPEGVEEAAFEAVAPASRAGIVYLGRLDVYHKGLDRLLDAFARVAGQIDGPLIIAGDGGGRAELTERCDRLGIRDRVAFVGRVDGVAKYELLAGAQVVVMPSRFEAFGIVAIEALACGTPVLAFDIDSLRDVVPADVGVLVPDDDVDGYADALVTLLRSPERREKMGDAGRRFARQFSWDDIARRQEQVYIQAVGSLPAPAGPAPVAVIHRPSLSSTLD